MIERKKNFFLDDVVAVEGVGKQDTYDFTVPDTHCFVANDILVHNTLEEIAGCAILLHWKYYYDKSASKSEYTIIVAKNREGQTGYVKVDFEPECYRFKNTDVKQEEVKSVNKKEQQIDFKQKQAHDLED